MLMVRESHQINIDFFDQDEKDLIVTVFGYENMNYIKPYDFPRFFQNHSIHIVISGSGFITIGDKTTPVQSGDCFATPPNVKAFYYPDEEDKWEYVWFDISGRCAEKYYTNLGFSIDCPVIKCRDFEQFMSETDRLLTDYESNGEVGYYRVVSLFYRYLDTNVNPIVRKVPNLSERAGEYVQMHYTETDLTVDRICRALSVSHSHLSRVFKESKGMTIRQYIIQTRLEAACRLLRESNLGVKEISHAVGFADNVHFIKSFKKHIKTTPKNYKQYKNIRDFHIHSDIEDITEFIRHVSGADDN